MVGASPYDLTRKRQATNGVRVERKKPDVEALLVILNEHGVDYVVTGSAAAMLHCVVLEPGDLDITPALDQGNLDRLRHVLEAIHARQYEGAPFGHWETDAAGEHSVLVEAVSDLLTTLTVPRREKDADQVRELRRIQTSFTHSDAACSPERDDGL